MDGNWAISPFLILKKWTISVKICNEECKKLAKGMGSHRGEEQFPVHLLTGEDLGMGVPEQG